MKFELSDKCGKYFEELKTRIASVLVLPNDKDLYKVYTNALVTWVGVDAWWESGCLCIKVVEESWEELPYTWVDTWNNSSCFEDLEVLYVWEVVQCLLRSQGSQVYLHPTWYESHTKKVDEVYQRLWLRAVGSSTKGGCGCQCFE